MDKISIDILQACIKSPDKREYWVEFAQACLDEKDYLGGYWAVVQALKITKHQPDDDINCWGSWIYDIGCTCAYYIGLHKESIDFGIQAWNLSAKNKRIIMNLKLCRKRMEEYDIHMLWPTVRPKMFMERHEDWIKKAENPTRIKTTIAVNTQQQREELNEFENVLIIGDKNPGVAYATYKLTEHIKGFPGDIVILASDDFYPPENWDTWVFGQFSDYFGTIVVNDSVNRHGVVTIPIMDYACLAFTNYIIYHPSYCHLFSDNEYYDNLGQQNLLKILQGSNYPLFEHKHWYHGKRKKDKADDIVNLAMDKDKQNYLKRLKLPLNEKLCYQI